MIPPFDPKKRIRTCLRCGKLFLSAGPGNRRCGECQEELDNDRDLDFSGIELRTISTADFQESARNFSHADGSEGSGY